MYIFISHSSKDGGAAKTVCGMLEDNGHGCFLAPRDIRAGREYAQEIVDGLDRADALVLMLSKNSNQSPHVLREIERAVSRAIPIVVYKMEEVELTKSMEYFLMMHQWTNGETDGDYGSILKCINTMELEKGTVKSNVTEGISGKDEKRGEDTGKSKKKRIRNNLIAIAAMTVILFASVWILNLNYGSPVSGKTADTELKLGDKVVLGSYMGEDITWKVLHFGEDGKTAVLIADNIITMKAYDVPDSGKYNSDGGQNYKAGDEALDDFELQAYVRGNSSWKTSNIRTWLNSQEAMVEYEGQAPMAAAMSEKKNGYNSEAGFLTNFSEDERAVLTEAEITTAGNALDGASTTWDKVFLLSSEELNWFEEANVSMYAVPTKSAVEQDGTGWYEHTSVSYGVKEYFWWLREPVQGSSSRCYLVNNGYTQDLLIDRTVAGEGFGIRPAVSVDVAALAQLLAKQNERTE